jgi:hypothetical protein
MTSPIYIALIFSDSTKTSVLEVLNYFNKLFPNNTLNITQHITDFTQTDTDNFLTNFLSNCPINSQIAIVTSTTTVTRLCSQYLQLNNLNILTISYNATSPLISTLTNVISYASSDKIAAINSFLIFKDYQMNELKILYDPLYGNQLFFTTYIAELTKQATLLNIKYSISQLVEGADNYDIKKKSCIFLFADTKSLSTKFITNNFLKKIPKKCYFLLTDINTDLNFNYFNKIPAFVILSTNINYTTTSKAVYDNIKNNNMGYFIYTLYDILFVLNYFTTLTNTLITKENWISIDPYQGVTSPAWILNSYINPITQCPIYGKYCLVYVNNIIIGDDSKLYLKYYDGGNQSLPCSNSIFKIIGSTPDNTSLIYYDEANYNKIYDKKGKLRVCRFDNDVTIFPLKIAGRFLNNGQINQTKFVYTYNSDGYYSFLKRLYPNNMKIPQVNETMSKTVIKLKYI